MISVSRETRRLARYCELVRAWNLHINIVAKSTISEIETRHIEDSRQIADFVDNSARSWLDFGSGGGFPGIVIAVVRPNIQVTLVESDKRKASFLRHAIRELELATKVLAGRVELLPAMPTDVISARAVAPLTTLLSLSAKHGHAETIRIFPKGEGFASEIDAAKADWRFTAEIIASKTREGSAILKLKDVRRA